MGLQPLPQPLYFYIRLCYNELYRNIMILLKQFSLFLIGESYRILILYAAVCAVAFIVYVEGILYDKKNDSACPVLFILRFFLRAADVHTRHSGHSKRTGFFVY